MDTEETEGQEAAEKIVQQQPSVIFSKRLTKIFGQTNAEYSLISEGDNILVGLSGGKDSLTMTHLIARCQKIAPFKFTFTAATLKYGMGEDYSELAEHCKEHSIAHTLIDSEIYEIAKGHIRENSSFCSFFSRMRRGALYSYALKNGYNKVALGHHLDDAAESFFMSLFQNGALRTIPPIYKAYNGLFVIRPLILIREQQTAGFARDNNFKTIGDEACPAMNFSVKMPYKRSETKEFLTKLEHEKPDLFVMLKSAFSHVHDESFFDKSRYKF